MIEFHKLLVGKSAVNESWKISNFLGLRALAVLRSRLYKWNTSKKRNIWVTKSDYLHLQCEEKCLFSDIFQSDYNCDALGDASRTRKEKEGVRCMKFEKEIIASPPLSPCCEGKKWTGKKSEKTTILEESASFLNIATTARLCKVCSVCLYIKLRTINQPSLFKTKQQAKASKENSNFD